CKFSIELKNFPPDLSGEPIGVVILLTIPNGTTGVALHHLSPLYPQKTRTSFSKNMYVFSGKDVRVFLKAKTMPFVLRNIWIL
ncbi:hypothetical protein, partial [Parabacteroides distasonis]|uniref:hypothetical protein n=1 Tax=Parabacteroides distasonis TaxID=823 RepID=UPI0023311F16